MGTSNFKKMEDFPLFVAETPMMRVCPECNMAIVDDTLTQCCDCGHSLDGIQEEVDEASCQWLSEEMQQAAERINEKCKWHKVSVESGYYSGVQFYVAETMDDPHCLTNDECKAYWTYDMCRSKAIRAWDAEVRRINRLLAKAADELGLMELVQVARFSNGETLYERIDRKEAIPAAVAVKIIENQSKAA